jgi:hypothetical protein
MQVEPYAYIMEVEMSFTDDEVAELRRLLEIERIRKVMHLYTHLMDAEDWDRFAQLFAEDAVGEWGPYGTWQGRDAIVKALEDQHRRRTPFDQFHLTTNFWVELTGEDSGVSRAYLASPVFPSSRAFPAEGGTTPFLLYALYENDYRKIDGEWRIVRALIEWIWPERDVSEAFPRAILASAIG